MALQPFVGPWPLFQFLHLFKQSAGLLGREISLRKAATCTQNSRNPEYMNTDIYVSSGIRTHGRSVLSGRRQLITIIKDWHYSLTLPSLPSALDGGELLALHPGCPTPRYPLDKRLDGPQGQNDAMAKRNISVPQKSNPDYQVNPQPVA
jgi:hypothetical protein